MSTKPEPAIAPGTQTGQTSQPLPSYTPDSVTVIGGPETAEAQEGPKSEFFPGTGRFVSRSGRVRGSAGGVPVTESLLNFVDADIAEVTNTILGDVLGLDYVIAEGVRGTMTLRSSRPMEREDLLATFEDALELYNFALVERNGVYQVMPANQAQGIKQAPRVISREDPEFGSQGVYIVPLQHISAEEAERILRPFAGQGAILRVDKARNLLMLSGSRGDMESLLETVETFDVDWLAGTSFAMFYPENLSAVELERELAAIFDRTGSPTAGLVDFITIPRLNALLAMAPKPAQLRSVRNWVQRLDRPAQAAARRIHYYRLQNAKAEDVEGALSKLLGATGSVSPQPAANAASNGSNRPASTPQQSNSDQPTIVTDTPNNALIIMATQTQFEVISQAIRQMDTLPDQVLIEATIAEVTLNDDLQYGVEWLFDGGSSQAVYSADGSANASPVFPGFAYTYITSSVQAAINAISSITRVDVLSSPKVMTLNNSTARLNVGDQVPVATQSAVTVTDPGAPIVSSIELRETGVILEVTPRISRSGAVIMEISQEVSDAVQTTSSGIDSPTIQRRDLKSTVAVQDGETIALGGLMRETNSRGNSGVPFLRKIPIFGWLFSSSNESTRRTELLVFIKPRIVRSQLDIRSVNDYLRGELRRVKLTR